MEQSLKSLSQVEVATVDYSTQSLRVAGDILKDPCKLKDHVKSLGYRVSPFLDFESKFQLEQRALKKMAIRYAAIAFSALWTMVLALVIYLEPGGFLRHQEKLLVSKIMWITALPGIIIGGFPIFRVGLRSLFKVRANIDTLITVGTFACLFLSLYSLWQNSYHNYLDSAVLVIGLISTVRLLERRLVSTGINNHFEMDTMRSKAVEVKNKKGLFVKKQLSQIKPGHVLEFKEGAQVLVDGEVMNGEGRLVTTANTGESLPTAFFPGTEVQAGSYLTSGYMHVKATKAYGERQVDKLYFAGLNTHHEQRFQQRTSIVDKIIAYAPSSLLILAMIVILLSVIFGKGWEESLVSSVSLLLVACPCAFYLTKPVLLISQSNKLKSEGIYIFRPNVLLKVAEISRVIFDKTGTLTGYQYDIEILENHSGLSSRELWSLLSGLENNVVHPIAQAVHEKAWKNGVKPQKLTREYFIGKGVQGTSNHTTWRFGKPDWADRRGKVCADHFDVILSSSQNQWASFRLITKKDRPEQSLFSYLKKQNIKTSLLSGDSKSQVENFINSITHKDLEVLAEQTPEQKEAYVSKQQQQGESVMFVGDGLNDAKAMLQSDIAICLPHSFSILRSRAQIGMEIPSRKHFKTLFDRVPVISKRIKQNYLFAITYNAITIPSSLFLAFSPEVAAGAMALSSGLILMNSLR